MKQAEAKRLILAKFDRWVKEEGKADPTGTDAFLFFSELSGRGDPALDFRCSGDPWQTVHAWLRRAKKLRRSWP